MDYKISVADTKYGKIHFLPNDSIRNYFLEKNNMPDEKLVLGLSSYISRSKVAIDCGANIGAHTILYKHINPQIRVYAFEPQSVIYNILKMNVGSLKDVNCYNCAIGNKFGNVFVDPASYSSVSNFGSVQLSSSGKEERVMISLDMLELDGCDFLKIDVEGFEIAVVLGAIRTIMKYRPVIFYENNHNTFSKEMSEISGLPEYKCSNQEVLALLTGLGYSFQRIKDDYTSDNVLVLPY
ncbi:MAG: FkbM family methyltransferase [Alphaproteobacteria bacterium]|nr:FkbM family methyltransferase [Alphaproteobacteria bacterium]